MKKQLGIKILAFGLSWLMLAAAIEGCRKAGDFLIRDDLNLPAGNDTEPLKPKADAMVMLMGTIADRGLQTADLYARGAAEKVIMVKENMRARDELPRRNARIVGSHDVAVRLLEELGVPAGHITVLEGDATSTLMEAEAMRDWLRTQPDLDTLILVSSSYHMRRASMIFRTAFKSLDRPVKIYCSPSAYTGMDNTHWWRQKEDIQVVASEYLKILYFLAFDKRKL